MNPFHACPHGVHFYDSDHALCQTVARFIAEGVDRHDPVVAIVTPLHHALIVERLLALNVNVRALLTTHALQLLDADDTLSLFMREHGPDGALFHRHIRRVMRNASEARSCDHVRAYGEMVNVLWQSGRRDHAINLEMLWNELDDIDLSLLCGYEKGGIETGVPPDDVLRQHTHMVTSLGHFVPVQAFPRVTDARQQR